MARAETPFRAHLLELTTVQEVLICSKKVKSLVQKCKGWKEIAKVLHPRSEIAVTVPWNQMLERERQEILMLSPPAAPQEYLLKERCGGRSAMPSTCFDEDDFRSFNGALLMPPFQCSSAVRIDDQESRTVISNYDPFQGKVSSHRLPAAIRTLQCR